MSIKKQIAKSAEGYPLLGYCVYWSMAQIDTRYSQFISKLEEIGVPTDIARPPQAKSALIKAIRQNNKGRKTTFHKKVIDDRQRAVFQVVNSNVDQLTENVDFVSETKVRFDKETKQALIEGSNAQEINERYENLKDCYDTDRFRDSVLRFIEKYCQSISIRDRGGVYFIPATKQVEFEKLQALFGIFPQTSLEVVPVIDTDQAKKSMWKALVGEVEQELATMAEDIQNNVGKDTSEHSVEVRLQRFQTLKHKVENYESLLSGTAEGLKSSLSDLSAMLRSKLSA